MQTHFQTTLKRSVTMTGIGLHKGRSARMTIKPAMADHGIWFKRLDVVGADPMVCASYDSVDNTTLCTRIANADGVTVSTIEHVMAALAGLGVSNALIELDGPEVPIMDGSSAPFVERIRAAGLLRQDAQRLVIRILEPVALDEGEAAARLEPAEQFEMDYAIDFPEAVIGQQTRSMAVVNGAFVDHLSDSRTFCRQSDVDALRAQGLALGGSLENAIVVEDNRVVNPEGFRHADECVRHKMLDAVGDLALAGAPIIGRYTGTRAGHGVTNRLLRKLFATPGAWRVEICAPEDAFGLPGECEETGLSIAAE
ncbi:MAG: UDP-3-O-acyl-N-acetylglucosamine deacetylase [Pseudomonadota bacterium]